MRRFLFAALFLLSACGGHGDRTVFTDSRIPPSLSPQFWPPEGWTWGKIETPGAPPSRYGVVGARGTTPGADVLVLTGYGDVAESWFETASGWSSRGLNVWVLEPAGQGGSGRWRIPHDLGHAPSLAADDAALRVMVGQVIRPSARRPLVIVAEGTAAATALAASRDLNGVDALALSAPDFAPSGLADRGRLLRRLGLGWLRPPGAKGWRRDPPPQRLSHDAVRGGVRLAWQTANPDLRMGDADWSWHAAMGDELEALAGPIAPRAPLLVLVPTGEPPRLSDAARSVCKRTKGCRAEDIPGALPDLPHEADAWRAPWLAKVEATIDAAVAARAR